jgi:septin family protein
LRNTSGHDITNLDINAMLIDNKGQNVGMVPAFASADSLTQGQSTSFSGVANEDSQNAADIAYKMTFGWQ